MKKCLHYAYAIFMIISLTFIVTSFFGTPLQPGNGTREIIKPISVDYKITEKERTFLFDVEKKEREKKDLSFYTKHQYVTIYADEELLYTYDKDGGVWGHTPGAYWVFVDVPENTSKIKVVFRSAYDTVKFDIPDFYIGNELASHQEVFQKSIIPFLCSMLIMIFGLILMVYWKLVNHRFGGEKSLLYLGQFSAIIGLYLVLETDAVTITVPYRVACVTTTYVLLMMLVPSGLRFCKEFLGTVENVLWKIICICNGLAAITCILLQMFHITDLRETLAVTHTFIIIALSYVILTMLIKLIKREITPALKVSIIAFGMITLSSVGSIFLFYEDTSKANTSMLSMFGFMFFVLVLSVQAMQKSMDLLEQGRKMAAYKELATMDMLTGLNNRNAYISDIEIMEDCTDTMIVTFDLNNLKKCNDSMGHNEGDDYIYNAGNLIKEVFVKYGKCYRIGGDEFCVLIKKSSACPITEVLQQLEAKVAEYNQNTERFPMCISYGYAVFDKEKESNIEKTRDRADARMYEYKRQSKCTIYKNDGD